jgi:alkanesulfonate monooxygenase
VEFSVSLENKVAAQRPEYGFDWMLRLAEQVDSDSPIQAVWVNDSLIDTPGFEPISTLGAVAARTRRVKIGTSILQSHYRNPAVLALSWATLDHASQGRTILGLGIGGGTPDHIRRECDEVGIKSRDRGKILENTVSEVRAMWQGEHERIALPVRPLQTHVPIWISAGIFTPAETGASTQAGKSTGTPGIYNPGRIERVARLADGWFTLMATPSEIQSSVTILAEEAQRHGRSLQNITPCLELWVNVGANQDACYEEIRRSVVSYFNGAFVPEEIVRRWSVWGSPQQCKEQLAAFEEAGIRHVKFVIGAEDPISQIETLICEVLT